MKKKDCLFIGHNEMNFNKYESMVRAMGVHSPTYRDLNFNFITYKNEKYTLSEIYNIFGLESKKLDNSMGLLYLGNLFSATIAYLGTFLHRRGFTCDYVNSFQAEKELLAEKLKSTEIKMIIIPTTLYVSVLPVLEIMEFVKKYNTQAKVIIGGPFISTQVKTAVDEETLQYFLKSINADFYINCAQGEDALYKVIDIIKNNKDYSNLEKIDNIFYKKGNFYIRTATSIEDNKLEENMVDWSLFKNRVGYLASVRTAISCPFHCFFCAFPEHAGKYQTVNVDKVIEELDSLEALGTVKSLNFIDDTFNIPADRFKDLLRAMISRKYTFKWNSHFRCQFADRETVELMKKSGCEGVFLGIESGNDEILKNMNKVATVEKYKKGVALLKEYGILTYTSFIVGFPGETLETVKDTINFIEECKPDFYRTQLWYCDQTTPIWEQRDKFHIEGSQFHWKHKTMDCFQAIDLIENAFQSIQNSIWVPQYNFEFAGIFSLLHRGMTIDQIRKFLMIFNKGIKEKLENSNITETSDEIIKEFKALFGDYNEIDNNKISDKYGVDFDF